MYRLISEFLSDKKGGNVFCCFDFSHFCYIALVILSVVLIAVYLKGKSSDTKQKAIDISINVAFGIYILDFFLMPFSYGEIDVEKLPFHICTAMCVMSFWSRHNKFLARFKTQFALFGFVSNLVYLIYPAGVMWYQVHPLSYRVIQTLLFHGTMVIYGTLVLLYEDLQQHRRYWKDLLVIASMTLWAILGNLLYTGEAWGCSNNFNWFFVRQDPFNIIPADIAPWIMPVINIAVFAVVEMGISGVFSSLKKRFSKTQSEV